MIIGIDLGTTYSAVACVREGLPEVLPSESERIIPSVVGFTPEGQLVVGTAARNQYVLYPERTVRSIKRQMGTETTVSLNGRDYTPAEISAIILREMKKVADAHLPGVVDGAVITVPAHFSDAARQATRDAGEIASLKVERIINEPTAAALAYGLDRMEERQLVAVYDLGGGTFDVSIVELNQGVIEVRASHGNTQLGGDDFDERLVQFLAQHFEREHKVDPRGDRRALARLSRAAEEAKRRLSAQPFAQVREEYLLEHAGKPFHLEVEISRREFEGLIKPMIEETMTSMDQALKDAGLEAGDLDRVLFVGGSTRIPLVWEIVAGHVGLEPMVEINPDEAVALGAGVQAAIIDGQPLEAILVDVAGHSLGIEVAEWSFGQLVPDHYGIILHRNTSLPAEQARVFTAITPDQTSIQVKVYQGESSVASQNTLLGEFLFEDLKQEVRGEPPNVAVQFDLDLNGILQVSAQDRGSGQVKQTTLRAAHTRLDPRAKEASARHVAGLWGETPAGGEPGAEDDPLLARAEQLLEARLDGLEPLADLVARLKAAKLSGDTEGVAQLNEQLLDVLYDLEDTQEDT